VADHGLILRDRIRQETAKALQTAPLRKWPVENCVVFCADIYLAAGLPDLITNYRGTYRTEEEAYRVMGLFGMHGLHVRCAKKMAWPRIAVAGAQDGDWGLCRTERGPSSSIRYGGFWINSRVGGYAVLDDRNLLAAWKVC
jgi:hypothetical protein